jgi:Fe2+ or Zn2+ uptake regulation protein
VDSTRALFSRHDLRCTEQRRAVYETLWHCKSHPTADELHHMTRVNGERLSLATVYNTLDALCEAGLAQKLPTPGGCCRYDADTSDHLHVRFRETSQIQDVPQELGRRLVESVPKNVLDEIERALGIRIEGMSIQLTATTADGSDG